MIKQSTYLRRAISALKNAGWILISVDDGDGRPQKVKNTAEAMKIVESVEDATLYFENATLGKQSWIRAIWQGPDDSYAEGDEIVSDYGMNIDSVLSKIRSNPPSRRPARKGKRARKNPPPMYGSRTRKIGTKNMIGLRVYEIRYQHAADGKDYKHPFETGVVMWGMPDGSIMIESATGLRLWENRDA